MKSLCIVLGFTLLLAAAYGMTLLGGWMGLFRPEAFRSMSS